MAEVRVIKLNESVYSKNDNQADMTRRMLNDKKVFFVNIMSSPEVVRLLCCQDLSICLKMITA